MTRTDTTAQVDAAEAATPLPGELTRSFAPVPTAGTLRLRTSLPYQAYRFGRVSLKVLRMVRRSHSQ